MTRPFCCRASFVVAIVVLMWPRKRARQVGLTWPFCGTTISTMPSTTKTTKRTVTKAKHAAKTGRPPKGEDRKGDLIRVRVTAEQKATLSAAAERAGLDVSSWLRALGLREAQGGGE